MQAPSYVHERRGLVFQTVRGIRPKYIVPAAQALPTYENNKKDRATKVPGIWELGMWV